jgi:hypothetical protein
LVWTRVSPVKTLAGEQMQRCFSRCSPFELRSLSASGGIRTRCLSLGKRRSIRCDHHRPFFLVLDEGIALLTSMTGEQAAAELSDVLPLDHATGCVNRGGIRTRILRSRSIRCLHHRPILLVFDEFIVS